MAGAGSVTLLPVGMSPAAAMGMTYVAMAGSLSLAMENAVAAQQRGQVTAEAATAQILSMVIAAGLFGIEKG